MMKKFLLGSLMFVGMLFANGAVEAKESFANYYSTTLQTLASGDSVAFENSNEVRKFDIDVTNTEIEFHYAGTYQITFTAVGGVSVSAAPEEGPWSLGLYLNGVLVPGSIAGASSGTDSEDAAAAATIVGQVIIAVEKGDILQLKNTASTSVYITPDVSGGVNLNDSASILIQKL